jgi:hypothetical protein
VQTADVLKCRGGTIRLECVRSSARSRQGFDVKMQGGVYWRQGRSSFTNVVR